MKVINVLADRDSIANYALAPLIFNKKTLFEMGFDVRIKYKVNDSLFECNTLCVISKSAIRILKEKSRIFNLEGSVLNFLQEAREKVDNLIWMDDSDSTSVTHFEVLSYVDKYLKKQLFKDKSLYRKDYYGGRIFSDYYHENFDVNDVDVFQQHYPLEKKHEEKVALSWNIGLGNMHESFTLKSYIKRIVPLVSSKPNYNQKFVNPNDKKPIDLYIRTSANLARPSVAFHRQELLRKLTGYQNNHKIIGMVGSNVKNSNHSLDFLLESNSKRIPTKKIRKIMEMTKVMPSPFGWGELGVRDYEAFKYGALLLKPDMSHMETWPNLFVPEKTFVPLNWSFSDLAEKMDKVLSDETYRIEISIAGQDAYKASISEEGMNAFCNWFTKQIEIVH